MNGIQVEGFEDIEELLKGMTLTEDDEKRAMTKALNPVKSKLSKETPKGATKKLSKIKVTIKKDGLATMGVVRLGAWWDIFQEFGTSYQKHHVGFFERSINSTTDQVMKILGEELLKNKSR